MAITTATDWARYILSGGSLSATDPTDADLAPLLSLLSFEVATRYPCLSESLSGTDLTRYQMGLGHLIAREWLAMQVTSGKITGSLLVRVKIGPVTEEYKSEKGSAPVREALTSFAWSLLYGIGCVRLALLSVPPLFLFDRYGPSRAKENCDILPDEQVIRYALSHRGATSANILTVQSASSGTGWAAFPSTTCDTLDIVNNTGTDIEYRRGGGGSSIVIPDGSARAVTAITNASEIEVRRVDQSTTQVTLTAEAIVE